MSVRVLSIGPAHTLREAARMMAARQVGVAVVVNPDHAGVGILTERDILLSVASGESPDAESAGEHCTQDLVFAARDWTMEDAAATMVRCGFRHLVVVEGQDVVGLLSMRDIVRCWSATRIPAQATTPVAQPSLPAFGTVLPGVEPQVFPQGGGAVLGEPDDPPGAADEAPVVAQGGEQGGSQGSRQVVALPGPVGAEPQQGPGRARGAHEGGQVDAKAAEDLFRGRA